MPVRNGYEVCRYVKEDSALSHIPVILLVGAFDPLDEQEAQRVGADGVLKKPFVPPDPLISMVKSALTRAGVPLGPQPTAEKPAAAPPRTSAEILGGGSSKLVSAEKLPEATPEPVEEFPAPLPQVRIPEGQGPLAFGNLLDAKEKEEEPEPMLSSKPMINIAGERNWNEEPADVPEEEDEEDSRHGGWRPGGGMEEEVDRAAASSPGPPDWRDEAFHGNSPAKNPSSSHWAPSAERTSGMEAVEIPAVATSTLETKHAEVPAPFASDARTTSMAAGVEEKMAETEAKAAVPPTAEPEPVAPAERIAPEDLPGTVAASLERSPDVHAPALEEVKATEPGNWAVVPENSWEAEAKRASMLASTWDAPPAPTTEETQEVSAYAAEQSEVHVEHSATSEDVPPSPYSGHWEPESETPAPGEESRHAAATEPRVESSLPNSWANTWETPAAERTPLAPEGPHAEPAVRLEPIPQLAPFTEPAPSVIAQAPAAPEPAVETAAVPSEQPNMDELVARVLGKMNPEVLQKVTREILKPVIEAIVRDELNSKK